jgi:hypothetical protein
MALMAAVLVDSEPVAIQMSKAAVRTCHGNRLKTEDARNHVVNRVDFVDLTPSVRQEIDSDRYSQLPICEVNLLLTASFATRVNMDASVDWPRSRVIDRRYRTPKGDPARV